MCGQPGCSRRRFVLSNWCPTFNLERHTFSPAILDMGSNTLAAVQGGWPRRLMHVGPSCMTSFERQPGNIYNNHKEPRYNILTYTWGRFELRNGGRSIDVAGIDWDVPAVRPSHFSVEQFKQTITRIAQQQEVNWIWLDVACIDQRDGSLMKKEEIGRQIAIFEKAERVYAWLTSLSLDSLQRNLETIEECAMAITSHDRMEMSLRAQTRWARKTLRSIQSVIADPWFSSLWTLQEAYLRRDACMLPISADISDALPNKHLFYLYNLFESCTGIYRSVLSIQNSDSSSSWSYNTLVLDEIVQAIERSGCYALTTNSPLTLYGAASFRSASHPCDRIYGIMQVFGLNLGVSAIPEKEFELDDLQLQLAQALNARSPILAQLFVHVRPPSNGQGWQISQFCATPERTRGGVVRPESLCKITFPPDSCTTFLGRRCKFEDIADYWNLASNVSTRSGDSPVQSIHLDRYDGSSFHFPSWAFSLSLGFDNRQNDITQLLMLAFPKLLFVGLLGCYKGIARGRTVDFNAGLILRQSQSGATLVFTRIGFCLWERAPPSYQFGYTDFWEDCECFLK
jgi:hypothetical protein